MSRARQGSLLIPLRCFLPTHTAVGHGDAAYLQKSRAHPSPAHPTCTQTHSSHSHSATPAYEAGLGKDNHWPLRKAKYQWLPIFSSAWCSSPTPGSSLPLEMGLQAGGFWVEGWIWPPGHRLLISGLEIHRHVIGKTHLQKKESRIWPPFLTFIPLVCDTHKPSALCQMCNVSLTLLQQ